MTNPDLLNNYDLVNGRVCNTTHKTNVNITTINADYDLTGATIILQVRKTSGVQVVKELTNENGGITINPPYSFSINRFVASLPAGVYKYDVLIKFATGFQLTIIGGSWTFNSVISEL